MLDANARTGKRREGETGVGSTVMGPYGRADVGGRYSVLRMITYTFSPTPPALETVSHTSWKEQKDHHSSIDSTIC